MLAVRQSPDVGTSLLFMDAADSGPSSAGPSAPWPNRDEPEEELETPPTPRRRATTSRSRSATPAGDRKYKCQWEGCDKAYTKPSRLAEHELSHTGEVRSSVLATSRAGSDENRDGTHALIANTLTSEPTICKLISEHICPKMTRPSRANGKDAINDSGQPHICVVMRRYTTKQRFTMSVHFVLSLMLADGTCTDKRSATYVECLSPKHIYCGITP